MLPEVVARYGTWYAHDVYASGSAEMIQATVAMFRELHVPIERIRYDAFGELERAAARP
jgi:NAD(P)H-flavin reductase